LLTSYSVVLAITKANVDGPPALFKTNDTSTSYQDCTIWQVARATSAATTFFKSIQLGRDKIEFIDAGFGYNNPTEILVEEAEKEFPGHGQLHILSIGTGLGRVVTIHDSRRSILSALKTMASESTKVARKLDNKYKEGDHYHRFNVDRGLDDVTLSDYQKASTIAAHTRNYLHENQRAIQNFLDDFLNSPKGRTVVVEEQSDVQAS
jgi:patatin-like phospholipase/acyl hydrolase